jgi:hypothetical protein
VNRPVADSRPSNLPLVLLLSNGPIDHSPTHGGHPFSPQLYPNSGNCRSHSNPKRRLECDAMTRHRRSPNPGILCSTGLPPAALANYVPSFQVSINGPAASALLEPGQTRRPKVLVLGRGITLLKYHKHPPCAPTPSRVAIQPFQYLLPILPTWGTDYLSPELSSPRTALTSGHTWAACT